MKKIFILLSSFILINSSFAQQKVSWNGYLQYRLSDNYLNQTNFSLRRAKFWVNGLLPPENGAWSYKLQANFLQQVKFQFLLQDVFVNYKINNFEVTAGQFVPDFSLQRNQPDYAIPIDERADVVNALVPGAETMARDIGVELKLADNKTGSFSFGFFNGNGANTVSNQRNFLYVHRGSLFLLNNSESKLELGYYLSYRDAHDLQFSKIFGNNYFFTGNDFRFGFEEKLNLRDFELQSEYIEAHLGNQKAYGYYALADYLFAKKNLITLSVEQLNDLNPSTVDNPWYVIGYSYLIKRNDIKISLDNKFQFASSKTNALTTLQIQYFFN
ncbi:MAG: OprO/OprP family phosphate-selective porin [Bacteroidetes bacterium]|nr:OprO/OprP family phosphate-selective porin [Bacteroidota bacterium]